MKKYLKLNDISAYKIAFSLSNYVWQIVVGWNHFERSTIGAQFVRAVDSISANIAEGFGRYSKKEKVMFYRYAIGSLKEALDWNEKAHARHLLTDGQYQHILDVLKELPREVYSLIKFSNEHLTI